MGQQQLILLVLATIIVGLAIIVGIRAYSENSNKANIDAMMQTATRAANDVQSWAKRPQAMGGPSTAASAAITSAGWAQLGYPATGGAYVTTESSCTLAGGLITCNGLAANEQAGNQVQVRVCGLSDDNIVGAITSVEGAGATGAAATCPTAG